MWIDSHAHLYGLSHAEISLTLERCKQQQVDTVVNTAVSLATARTVIDQLTAGRQLRAAVGVSPFDVLELDSDWLSTLSSLATHPLVVGIGETGLDDSNPRYPNLDKQIGPFEAQADLAKRVGKPLIVHSRGAETDVVRRCQALGLQQVLFHCFTGTTGQLDTILNAGYSVSFSGIITFRGAALDTQLRMVPDERLFLETDSPYLSPVPLRGTPNCPSRVALIASYAAAIRGVETQTLAAALKSTFDRFFKTSTNAPI